MVKIMMSLGYSIQVIRGGQTVLTSTAEENNLFPGFGEFDPDTRRRGLGTYSDFIAEYSRVRAPQRAAGLQANYSF